MSLAGTPSAPRQDYSLIADRLGVTWNDRLSQSLIAHLRVGPQSVVVDVGCGTAGDSSLIARRTRAKVVGVDSSLAMLSLSQPPSLAVLGDALSLPLRGCCADAAFSANVIQLLSDRRKMFAELARVLRGGGRFALPLTTRKQLRSRFINQFFPRLFDLERLRYPTVRALSAELKAAGFLSVRCVRLDLGSFTVDKAYLDRQRTGIVSGLGFVPEPERSEGLLRLERFVTNLQARGRSHQVRWIRTLLVARKAGGRR